MPQQQRFLPIALLLATCSVSVADDQFVDWRGRTRVAQKAPNGENSLTDSANPTGRSEGKDEGSSGRKPVADRSSSQAAKAKGEINFDDLKFDIVKDQAFTDSMLHDEIRQLDGKKVKLRGYILPATLYKEKDIDQFVLVRDNQECCFGPGAALFDAVMIEMEPGKTTDFVTRPVTVEGKFEIDTNKYRYPRGVGPKGATHLAIFRIRGIKVK